MSLFKLTLRSILSRKLISGLLVVSIGLSAMLLIGVQKIKHSAKDSFSHSISGTDLIVGARSGDIQLLLYSVFRQGRPVANISWKSVQSIRSFSEVDWVVPMSLGDSHRGYPVLGTSTDYFQHYRYGRKQPLKLESGRVFQHPFEIVLGSEVARTLGYRLGQALYLSHGIAKGGLPLHTDTSFNVVGILKPTGTPVDKTVHIPIQGFTALHIDTKNKRNLSETDLTPRSITSALVGLHSKFAIFSVQRRITDWPDEPLMAIIPGVSLSRLWATIRSIDTAFLVITVLVVIIAFIGLLLALFMSLQQRRRELAVLRTMGARPSQLFFLLTLESLIITVSGVIFGLVGTLIIGYILTPVLEDTLGLVLTLHHITVTELSLATGIILFGLVISLVPGILAYRNSLSDGFLSL